MDLLERVGVLHVHSRYSDGTATIPEILDAAKRMVDRGAQMLMVVENGKVVGLLTLKDLARESPALAAMVFCKTVSTVSQGLM